MFVEDYTSSFCSYHRSEKMKYVCYNPECEQQFVFCKKCIEKNHPHHNTLRIEDLFLKLTPRTNARATNRGWRLDYFVVNKEMK